MGFNRMLNALIEKHGSSSADICKATGLSRSYVSKIRSGGFLPADYRTVLEIAGALALSGEELYSLSGCYLAEKSGMEETWSALESLHKPRDPVHPGEPAAVTPGSVEGLEQVLGVVRAVAHRENSRLCLFLTPVSDALQQLAGAVCMAAGSADIQWITLLDSRNASMNLRIYAHIVSSLLAHPAHVHALQGDAAFLHHHTPFPCFLLSGQYILLLSETGDRALCLADAPPMCLYREQFDKSLRLTVPFISCYADVADFMQDIRLFPAAAGERMADVYILNKTPCVILESPASDIHSYIAPVENADTVAEQYIRFLRTSAARIQHMFTLFPEDGPDIFLNKEDFCELTPHLTKPLPHDLRRSLLQRLAGLADAGEIHPHMLRTPSFLDSPLHLVNIWTDGHIILLYDLGDRYRIFTAFEPGIADSLIKIIQSMRKCSVLRTTEETTDILRRTLEQNQ